MQINPKSISFCFLGNELIRMTVKLVNCIKVLNRKSLNICSIKKKNVLRFEKVSTALLKNH